jgi:hypothetical protein
VQLDRSLKNYGASAASSSDSSGEERKEGKEKCIEKLVFDALSHVFESEKSTDATKKK